MELEMREKLLKALELSKGLNGKLVVMGEEDQEDRIDIISLDDLIGKFDKNGNLKTHGSR